MHLSNLGILELVLKNNVVPSVLLAIYNCVEDLDTENQLVSVGGKRSATSADEALLHTPPKQRRQPLSDEEDWNRVLADQWEDFHNRK